MTIPKKRASLLQVEPHKPDVTKESSALSVPIQLQLLYTVLLASDDTEAPLQPAWQGEKKLVTVSLEQTGS